MKSKLSLITMAAIVAFTMTTRAQNTPSSGDAANPAAPTTDAGASQQSAATEPSSSTATAVSETTPAAADTSAKPADAAAPTAAETTPATESAASTSSADAAAPVAATPAAPEAAAATSAAATEATTVAPVVAANDATPATNGPAVSTSATPDTTPAAAATAQPAAANDANANAAPAATAPAAQADATAAADQAPTSDLSSNTIIPLIVMDDVPLTDAIKNLARQAGLNYMLDPKIGFGQPGPNGQPTPQPSVSIRWEKVTAAQALNALLNNYSLQLQEDPRTQIARITVKDPAAPDPLTTHIFQLKYASPSNIVAAVQNALIDKRSKVVADIRTSQLVVVATEKEQSSVETLINKLDTITKQVLIEAKLLETSVNPVTSKGLDWSGTFQSQHLALGNNLQHNSDSEALNNTLSQNLPRMLFDTAKGFNPATAFLDADGVAAVFSFLNKDSDAKVISSPRTVTLDNEPARIEVTRASPIINITPGTVQVSGGSQITYTNLGVILNVTPRISANNYVNLKVSPEVSRIFDTITRVVGGANNVFQADEYDIRKMETRVMIPSGNTLVLGGLVQDDVRNSTTKVPVLGDIPLLGSAFRSNNKSRQKSNLIIFITPTIVQDEDYQKTSSDYLRTPAPTSDSVEGPWSSWDSGKPKDWSKPSHAAETTSSEDNYSPVALAK